MISKKTFVWVLILGAVVGWAWVYFLPDSFLVRREVVIQRSAERIVLALEDFHQWNTCWSPWIRQDSGVRIRYGGRKKGPGARMEWSGEEVGKGAMELVYVGADSVSYLVHFQGFDLGVRGRFEMLAEGGGTKVVWIAYGRVGFWSRIVGVAMDRLMGPDFERGLANLKRYVEQMPREKFENMKHLEVREGQWKPIKSLLISIECTANEMGFKLEAAYRDIFRFMQKKGLGPGGSLFAVIRSFSPGKVEVEAGVPVLEEVSGEGFVVYKEFDFERSVMCFVRGPYSNLARAHQKLADWILSKGQHPVSPPMEVYVKGWRQESDSLRFETLIVYAVE